MAFSILPDDWASTEAWLTRSFLLLGLCIIGPWVALIAYDLVVYVIRIGLFAQPAHGDGHGQGHGQGHGHGDEQRQQQQQQQQASDSSDDQFNGRLVSWEVDEERRKAQTRSRSHSASRHRGRAKAREEDGSGE